MEKIPSYSLDDMAAISVQDLEECVRLQNKHESDNPTLDLLHYVKLVGTSMEYSDLFKLNSRSAIKSLIALHGALYFYVTISPADSYNILHFLFQTVRFIFILTIFLLN